MKHEVKMQEINILSEYGMVLSQLGNYRLGRVIKALIMAENGQLEEPSVLFGDDETCRMIYDTIITAHCDYYADCFKTALDAEYAEKQIKGICRNGIENIRTVQRKHRAD